MTDHWKLPTTESSVTTTGGLSGVPQSVMNLAQALARKHGDVTIARENRGLHLYMASPEALSRDGAIEIKKRHLALNAERYLAIGPWSRRKGTYDQDRSARCMKYEKAYNVSELLAMSPLAARGIQETTHDVKVGSVSKHLVDDGNGNMIPPPPGKVLALGDLSEGHPALVYLKSRGFSPKLLEDQFGASYCYEEALPRKYYPELSGGFRDTPQGRIVFNIDMYGVRRGWQARLIEMIVGDAHLVWHPYADEWQLLKVRSGKGWELTPAFTHDELEWKPSKYKTGTGTARNSAIMGLDAALKWNKDHGTSTLIVCEGPLTAAKFRSPAVATLGKSISFEQARIIRKAARRAVYVPDNDLSGTKATARAREVLTGLDLKILELPKDVNDAGELSYDAASALIMPFIK